MNALFTDDKKINAFLGIFYFSYIALMLIITIDTLLLASSTKNLWPAWLLQILPLVMLLPGIWVKRYRTYSWVCFLMLVYFCSYVVQVYTNSNNVIDWLGLLATMILFVTAMYASRFLQRYFLNAS